MKKSKLVLLAFFVLILNLIWEFSHYKLYIDLTGISPTIHLIIANFTDLILIFFIFLIISVLRKSISWIENPDKFDYFVIIILGMLIATIIEIYSLFNDRWAYTELMPTIFGIGLSPLIQLFTTAIISLWLFGAINLRRKNKIKKWLKRYIIKTKNIIAMSIANSFIQIKSELKNVRIDAKII